MKRIWEKVKGAKLNVKFTVLITGAILLPIIAFSLYVFRSMEATSIHEKKSSLEYSMNQSYDQIIKNIESINMSTQFFLSDQKLKDFLEEVLFRHTL